MVISITVEVHALQPAWIDVETPKYRLYVNDDLITERTWIWNMQTYIEEYIRVDVMSGISNTIRVELIKSKPMDLSQISLQNLKINGHLKSDSSKHRTELSFISYKYNIPRNKHEGPRIFKRI
jgi:hypothetical protein